MRYSVRGWMWWGPWIRAIAKLIFYSAIVLMVIFMLSAVLYFLAK